MRHRTLWSVLTLLLVALLPRQATAQDTCDLVFGDFDEILEGRIGARDVRARLGRGTSSDPDEVHAVSGEFNYGSRWKTGSPEFLIDGVLDPACSIRLNELDSMRRTTGTWVLRFTNGRFEGTRADAASRSAEPIVLQQVADVDCSGRGPWRTFRSNSWPITFNYPANWQLTEDAGGLELLCPSPDRLIYDDGRAIRIERDVDLHTIVTADGRQGIEAGRLFVRFPPGPWMMGDYEWCAKEGAGAIGCDHARTARRFGMTVVQSSGGEDRLYTRHGYVGQGWGNIASCFSATFSG
jgi:hypothetical protein